MSRSDGRVRPGQKLDTAFSARAWNRAQDAADLVLGDRGGLAAGDASGRTTPYTWCYAKNTTDGTVPRWGVLAIDGLEIEPAEPADAATASFEQMPVLSGVTPEDGDKAWCVAVEPIAASGVGKVAVSGVVQVKIKINNANDKFVKVGTSVQQLESGGGGEGAILWKETGTGSGKWALIRLGGGGAGIKIGKTTAAWPKGETQNVRLWPNQVQSDPAEVQPAYNLFAQIGGDKWVAIASDDAGDWYLVAAEC